MILATLRRSAALLLGLSLLLTGCGGEKAPKVDLNAKLAALETGDADAKAIALGEIAQLGPDAAPAIPKLLPLLKDPDNIVRRNAAYVLGQIGPAAKAAIPELKAMMQTDNREQMTVVGNALRAIDPSTMSGVKIENTTN